MKARRWLCGLLAAVLLLGLGVPATALEKGRLLRVANCGSWAALRLYADAGSERLAKVPAGAPVVYGGVTVGGYRLVSYGGKPGFIHSGCLEKQNRALRVARATWLRDGQGRKLKKLKKGAVLVAASDAGNGWFRVYSGGRAGYADSTALRAASPKDGRPAISLAKLSLREGSSSGAKRIARVPKYAGVYCFGDDGRGHEYVCWSGKFGFVDMNRLLFVE